MTVLIVFIVVGGFVLAALDVKYGSGDQGGGPK